MQLAAQATRGAKWTGLASGVNAAIGVAQLSIVARFLEPSDFGAVALVQVVLAVANVFVSVGFSDVLVVRHDASPEQLSTMYWLNILVGFGVYGLVFVGAPLLALVIERDGIENLARVMGLVLLMGSAVVQFNALMRRELRLKEIAVIGLVAHGFAFIVVVALASTGAGVWSLVVAALVSQALTSASLFVYATLYGWLPDLCFDIKNVNEMVRFGVFRIGAALINTVNTKADQLVIGAILGATALGLYTVVYNLAMQPFSRINPILTQVSFPVFAKIKEDNTNLRRGYRKGLRMLMAINAPLLIGAAVVAPLLVPMLLGPGWEASIPVFQILCLFVLLRSASNINIGLILAKEKYRWPLYWNLLLLLIIPATIFLTAKIFGSLIVVSLSVVCIQVGLSVMGYILFARRLIGGFTLGYLNDFGRPVLTSILMAVGVFWLRSEVDLSPNWLGVAVVVAVGAALYIGLSFILQPRHTRELITLARAKM